MLLAGCRTGCGKITAVEGSDLHLLQVMGALAMTSGQVIECYLANAATLLSSSCHLQGWLSLAYCDGR